MSQLVKHIHAYKYNTYFFKIALDHAPEPDEVDDIETRIKEAMQSLGVPAEQIGVAVFKSALPAGAAMEEEVEQIIFNEWAYLLFVLVRTEEGGFTEDPAIVADRTKRAFATFGELPLGNVAAIVLEDAYLEVETRASRNTPAVW